MMAQLVTRSVEHRVTLATLVTHGHSDTGPGAGHQGVVSGTICCKLIYYHLCMISIDGVFIYRILMFITSLTGFVTTGHIEQMK